VGSALGALKTAAKRTGLSVEAYQARIAAGEKWCTSCSAWHARDAFGVDLARPDGLATKCRASKSTGRPKGWTSRPKVNPVTGRPGPAPRPGRDGDAEQARARVNQAVRRGDLPRPNTLPCTDCAHVWAKGERRHEYDHHLGYDAEHHLDVQPVCTTCHSAREKSRGVLVRAHDASGRFTPQEKP
jgi:hypothetical protein